MEAFRMRILLLVSTAIIFAPGMALAQTRAQPPSAGRQAQFDGAQLYRTYCAVCHGLAGIGNGPMAEQLRRPPADLTKFTARNGGVFPRSRLERIVEGRDVPSHGTREMPIWGDVFRMLPDASGERSARDRIEAILKYVEAMQERAAQ
jgi:mono/diheme cytochrome c family protein